MKQVRVLIRGRVIGVFFRAWTKSQAEFLGLTGWVKNVEDHVEAVIQGEEEKIKKMIELLKIGPPSALIENVKVFPEEEKEIFNGFETRR